MADSWSPIWSKIVDSSLWQEKPTVRVLFMTILALKDSDHVCRCSDYELHQKSKLTPEETVESLKVLLEPDTKRPEVFAQEFDGRRIEKVEDGYLVLNGEKYRARIDELRLRSYKARKQREYRERERLKALAVTRGTPLPGETAAVKGQLNGTHDENFDPVKPKPSDSGTVPANELPQGDSGVKISRAFE